MSSNTPSPDTHPHNTFPARFLAWLRGLSFRTGVIVLLSCIPFYVLSFAQMLLPISVAAKGVLWTILFGLAKCCQYAGITILGVEGYRRLKARMKRKQQTHDNTQPAQ